MTASSIPLAINYLAVEVTSETDSLIADKFARLKQVCDRVLSCKVRVANIARHKALDTDHSYLVSISLNLSEGVELYTLRSPQPLSEDSFESAIADAFARTYRQLIELRFEKEAYPI